MVEWKLLSDLGFGHQGLIHGVVRKLGNVAVALALGFGRSVSALTHSSGR